MRVTLKTIAEKAGVHISTVDKVIHNRGGVSKEVEANIRTIIDELGYKTNPAGRALQRSGKRYKIAALLLDVDAQPYIEKGIRDGLKHINFDVDVTFETSGFLDVEKQLSLLRKAEEQGADGIILLPIHSRKIGEEVRRMVHRNIPVITVTSDLSGGERTCHVGQDAKKAAHIAGRMMGLFLRGQGKAAVITNSLDIEHYNDQVKTREEEFTAFIHDNYPNIKIVRYVESFEDRDIMYRETEKLLQTEPELEGIFIACGGVDAAGRAILDAGKSIQTSVVSFEEYPEILELIQEQVVDCTIATDLVDQGRTSLQLMIDYLVYGSKPETETIYLEPKILVKESL